MAGIIDGYGSDAGVAQQGFLRQLWRFSRPHTIVGTTLSLFALWIIGFGVYGLEAQLDLPDLLLTWIACIGANIYIVGLNQLTDVPLDRINKPYLPLASGAWSMRTGSVVALTCLAISVVATTVLSSGWLWLTVGLSLLLGTIYSLPPLRLKRFPFWAAFCIVAVRSLLVNVFLFAHASGLMFDASTLSELPGLVWLLVGVMFAFSIAIAWFKDLPDLAGDAAFEVRTLPVHLGAAKVLQYGTLVLASVLAASVGLALLSLGDALLANLQAVVFLGFLWLVRKVQLDDLRSLRTFYLGLWGLFFFEYLAFGLVASI